MSLKKVLSLVLLVVICLGTVITDAQTVSAFALGETTISKKGQKNGAKIYSYCIGQYKMSNSAGAAVVANSYREHGCDTTDTSGGYGAFQWINSRKTNCLSWLKKHYPKASSSDSELLKGQVAFAMEEAKKTNWKVYSTGNMNTSKHKVWKASSSTPSKGWKEFKNGTDVDQLANAWLNAWERSANRERDATKNEEIIDLYEKYKIFDGVSGAGSGQSYSIEDVLWIGDSRTVGVYNAKGSKGFEFGGCISQVSGNTATLKSIVEGKFNPNDISSQAKNYVAKGSLVKDKQIKKGTKVILSWFGVNQISDFKGTKEQYEKLIKDGYIVLCPTVAGINSKKYKNGVTNKQVESFNKDLKEWCNKTKGAYYLDISDSDYIKDESKVDSSDGLHFSTKNSKQIYKIIKIATEKVLDSISDAAAKEEKEEKKEQQQGFKVSGQVYDESHFITAGMDLQDSVLVMPDKSMLTVNEQTQIANWAENIDNQKETGVTWLRTLIAFFGILVTIYSLLIYLAYWLDRVNNIIPVYLLPILTFNHLCISPDDTSSFNPEVEGTKAVIHKDVIKIVFIGCTLGVLLMTGQAYKFVEFVWQRIDNFIGGA